MKRYKIEINNDNIFKQIHGTASDSKEGDSLLGDIDLSNLDGIDFNTLLGINNLSEDDATKSNYSK